MSDAASFLMFPPSLPEEVRARAFVADNGELGVTPTDAAAFAEACRRDGVEILGWELWIVDHTWDMEGRRPRPAPGYWCGGIPLRTEKLLAVVSGDGAPGEVELRGLLDEVEADWRPYARVNFTPGRLAKKRGRPGEGRPLKVLGEDA